MSLFFRNVLFLILQPGVVAGVIPYYLAKSARVQLSFNTLRFPGYVGIVVLAGGLIILLICVAQFAIQGQGTLSPADPTQKLVTRGLYRHSRNPMYIGVLGMLVGESLLVQAAAMWIYTAAVSAGFHLFVVFHEEPRLRRDFGEEYLNYLTAVRRWL